MYRYLVWDRSLRLALRSSVGKNIGPSPESRNVPIASANTCLSVTAGGVPQPRGVRAGLPMRERALG